MWTYVKVRADLSLSAVNWEVFLIELSVLHKEDKFFCFIRNIACKLRLNPCGSKASSNSLCKWKINQLETALIR